MKRWLISLAVVLVVTALAAASDTRKTFTLSVDPPDALIRVVSGSALNEQRHRSPATITASVPEDRELAKKAVVEITRERYKRVVIPLRNIRDGEVLKLRLEKDGSKTLKFRMVAPAQSGDIRIKDANVDLSFVLNEKQMNMTLTNRTSHPIHVVWQRAVYTDAANTPHRVMHPGIRYEDRNRSFPFQTIMPYMTVHQAVIPVDNVKTSLQKKIEETGPLFPVETLSRLSGKELNLLIPIQIDKDVVQYNFKIKILLSE
jgi:hypothetical protein